MRIHNFAIFADYFQFLLRDEGSNEDPSLLWTRQAVKDKIAAASDMLCIGTARNSTVPVTVEIHDRAPTTDDIKFWDQVVETEIDIPSGVLVVMGNEYFPEAERISIPPGKYGARVYYGDLNSIRIDGLSGEDKYRIVIWLDSDGTREKIEFLRRPDSDG